MDWEIIRYKLQLKSPNNRWETIKITYNQEDAELWLRVTSNRSTYPCRVVREETMRIDFADPQNN